MLVSARYLPRPDDLAAQVAALAVLGDRAEGLVRSAAKLAQRRPKLGTAPPALHLAMRLRDAAGDARLTGEIAAASAELARFQQNLTATFSRYTQSEAAITHPLDES
jgi:hypothetical protein